MRKTILALFGLQSEPQDDTSSARAVREIVDAFEQLPPERARWLAAFAYLLSRVAHTDLTITADETRAMEAIVRARADLPQEQAILAIQIAKSHARLAGGTENFLVAREFKELADERQKLDLLRCLYAVAAADGQISAVEDAEIGRIARQLIVSQEQLTSIRSEFRADLGFLR